MTEQSDAIPTFLHAKDVSKALSVSLRTVRRWIRDGTIPSVRVGRFRLVPRSAINALVVEAGVPVHKPAPPVTPNPKMQQHISTLYRRLAALERFVERIRVGAKLLQLPTSLDWWSGAGFVTELPQGPFQILALDYSWVVVKCRSTNQILFTHDDNVSVETALQPFLQS